MLEISVSGALHSVEAVRLYSEGAVIKWQRMVNEGRRLLQPEGAPFALWGSPGDVMAGSLLFALMGEIENNSRANNGFAILKDAASYLERLKARGTFVAVDKIKGIEAPEPSEWRSNGLVWTEINLGTLDRVTLQKVVAVNSITPDEIADGTAIREQVKALCVLPSEFLHVMTDRGEMHLRWSNIETYAVREYTANSRR